MKKIRWAVIGTGYIANNFAEGLQLNQDAERSAVVSRSDEKARIFARKYDFQSSYSDFQRMLDRERPDIVYIAVPNDCHFAFVMQALDAGVHVLCEKPMADNQKQLQAILRKASEKNRFVMEGMWTRCFPAIHQMRTWIENGEIGRILTVRAFFDIKPDRSDWQLWKAGIEHAGGALRDVGIYSLAMAFLGFPDYPSKVCSSFVSNGAVDSQCDLLLQYADGGTSMLSGSFNRISDHHAVIIGEYGQITVGPEFWRPSRADLQINNGSATAFDQPFETMGFQYEIKRVHECLQNSLTECPDFTWQESVQICTLIDSLRKEWNIVYSSD